MKLCTPTILNTMSWPQHLFHLWWTLERDQVIEAAPVGVGDLAVMAQLPLVHIFKEGNMPLVHY